jgi:hypothetical protein
MSSEDEYEYEDDDEYVYEDEDGEHAEMPSYRPPADEAGGEDVDEETVLEFCGITGAAPAMAKEYLRNAAHNLSSAVERYFLDVERGVVQPDDVQIKSTPPAPQTSSNSVSFEAADGKTHCVITLWAHGYAMAVQQQPLWEGKQRDYTDELGKEITVALDKK